jgi:glutamate dehydrogenase
VDAGVDSDLAIRVVSSETSAELLDIAEIASNCDSGLELIAGVYFALGTQLNYGWIVERAMSLPTHTHWDMLARAAALAELAHLKRVLTAGVLAEATEPGIAAGPNALVDTWRGRREKLFERYSRLLAEQRATGSASLSMLLVIVREMAALQRV